MYKDLGYMWQIIDPSDCL